MCLANLNIHIFSHIIYILQPIPSWYIKCRKKLSFKFILRWTHILWEYFSHEYSKPENILFNLWPFICALDVWKNIFLLLCMFSECQLCSIYCVWQYINFILWTVGAKGWLVRLYVQDRYRTRYANSVLWSACSLILQNSLYKQSVECLWGIWVHLPCTNLLTVGGKEGC